MTDEDLAKSVQAGNPDMFGLLMERYEEKLLRYGRKFLRQPEDIEDIVQDVFVSAYQNIKGFDTTQRFSPWIYRIAHNAFVNGLRRNSRNPLVYVDFDTFLAHPAYDDPVPREREQEETRAMLEKSLDQLDYKYREVLILYYLEDMPYKDIAEVLQVPQGTVGIRLKRAKEALRLEFEKLEKTMDKLKDKILHKIQEGEIEMRPRAYFMLRAAAVVLVAFAVLVLSVFICNFIFFTLRLNGHESLLARPGGLFLFMRFFPWELLVPDVLLLTLLDWLIRKFRFGYRTPLVYSAILLLALVFSAGFAIDRATDINDRVLEAADDDDLPFPFGDLYERAHRPLPSGFRPDFDNDEDDEIIMNPGV